MRSRLSDPFPGINGRVIELALEWETMDRLADRTGTAFFVTRYLLALWIAAAVAVGQSRCVMVGFVPPACPAHMPSPIL